MESVEGARRHEVKIIIFEGPDKTGKSTAIKQLCSMINVGETEEFGSQYNALVLNKPYVAYGNESLQFKIDGIDASLQSMLDTIITIRDVFVGQNIVLFIDRLHISERVYSELFSRETTSMCDIIDSELSMHETLLVHCVPCDVENTISTFEFDGCIDTLNFDEYRESVAIFEKYIEHSLIMNKIKYSYNDFDGLVNNVAKFLRGETDVQ